MFPESYVSCLNESVCAKSLVRLVAMLWTVASQSPLSMGFSRQEYWSGLPCPPPRHLPDPELESACPVSLALQMDSLPTEPPGKPLRMTGGVLKTTNARHSELGILNSDSA